MSMPTDRDLLINAAGNLLNAANGTESLNPTLARRLAAAVINDKSFGIDHISSVGIMVDSLATSAPTPAQGDAAVDRFVLKNARFDHPAGTEVFIFGGCTYGLTGEDQRLTGREHTAVTIKPNGDGPFFTVPTADLVRVPSTPPSAQQGDAKDALDAARYRWLRTLENCNAVWCFIGGGEAMGNLDAAIDAAMAALTTKGQV